MTNSPEFRRQISAASSVSDQAVPWQRHPVYEILRLVSSRAILRLLLRIGALLLVLASGIAGNVLLAKGQSDLRVLVVGGALVTLVGFVAFDGTLKRIGESSAGSRALDDAADAIAEAVRQQWEAAAGERGLIHPAPIPVRWQWTRSAVAGPVSEAVGPGANQVRFPPLPGMARVQAKQLAFGRLQDLPVVYAGIDSGRVVIIGGPGTGKTGTAILLLLEVLKYRERLPDAQRRLTPVPVLLNCRGWDPRRSSFSDWFVEQLKGLYGFLSAAEFGVNAIERLVTQRRLAIFLDGFDEIPQDLRPGALGALNMLVQSRLVLLSRSQELVDAVRDEYLIGAAALELLPVTCDDAADYLARCRVQPASKAWQQLIAQIRNGSGSVIADALNNPLTLTLVRDTFQDDAETRLLVPGRFTSSKAVEEFLLDRVLPAAYASRSGRPPPRYSCEQAQRWLQYVARQLSARGTRDLAWWQVPTWQPPAFRAAANGLVAALAFGAVGWIAFGARFAAVTSLVGFIAGSLVGAFAEWRPDDRPVQLGTLNWRALGSSRKRALNLIAIVTGLGYGGIAGLAFAIEGGAVLGFGLSIATFLAFQFAAAVSILIATPFAEANNPIGPRTAWRRDRAAGIAFGTVFGLVFGVLAGTTFGLSYGVSRGASFGGFAGLVAGMAVALTLIRSWDSRLAFLQIHLAGQGPVRLMDFLEDAHQRGVLRTVGPVYQFRHARLQDRLAA